MDNSLNFHVRQEDGEMSQRDFQRAIEIGEKLDDAVKCIAELKAKLRAWEETAEHYCKDDTPISPDGVRGYIAELEAQLAAAKQQADSGLDLLIDAMGEEGLKLDLAIIPRACAVIRNLRAHRDDLKVEFAAANVRIEELEGELENTRAAANEMYAVLLRKTID